MGFCLLEIGPTWWLLLILLACICGAARRDEFGQIDWIWTCCENFAHSSSHSLSFGLILSSQMEIQRGKKKKKKCAKWFQLGVQRNSWVCTRSWTRAESFSLVLGTHSTSGPYPSQHPSRLSRAVTCGQSSLGHKSRSPARRGRRKKSREDVSTWQQSTAGWNFLLSDAEMDLSALLSAISGGR